MSLYRLSRNNDWHGISPVKLVSELFGILHRFIRLKIKDDNLAYFLAKNILEIYYEDYLTKGQQSDIKANLYKCWLKLIKRQLRSKYKKSD